MSLKQNDKIMEYVKEAFEELGEEAPKNKDYYQLLKELRDKVNYKHNQKTYGDNI